MFLGREEDEKSSVPGSRKTVQRIENRSGRCGGGSGRERGSDLRRINAGLGWSRTLRWRGPGITR